MTFQLTIAAAREILAAASRSGAEGMALRVAAQPGRDGIAYAMGFDEPADEDTVVEVEGLTVLVAPASSSWLAGTVLDFVELDDGGRDFIFMQPPAATVPGGCATGPRSCGSGRCGGCS